MTDEYRLNYSDRGQKIIEETKDLVYPLGHSIHFNCALDLGCGSGGSLTSLSKLFQQTIGMDYSLSELILARKLLDEKSMSNVILVCGCAEYLPFKNEIFDFTIALDVVEHLRDQDKSMTELERATRKNGFLFLTSPNRYSIFPEPHVNLLGVGFLPRNIAEHYVKFRRGVSYEGMVTRVLSNNELSFLMGGHWGKNYIISLYKSDKLKRIKSMEHILKLPLVSKLIYFFYPVHTVIAYKK